MTDIRLLGHTNPRTTKRYAHLADDPLRAAAERIGSKMDALGHAIRYKRPRDVIESHRARNLEPTRLLHVTPWPGSNHRLGHRLPLPSPHQRSAMGWVQKPERG